ALGVGAENLRRDGALLLGVVEEALGLEVLAQHAFARHELGHDQAAAAQPPDEAAKDGIGNASHGRENLRRPHCYVPNAKFLKDHTIPIVTAILGCWQYH